MSATESRSSIWVEVPMPYATAFMLREDRKLVPVRQIDSPVEQWEKDLYGFGDPPLALPMKAGG